MQTFHGWIVRDKHGHFFYDTFRKQRNEAINSFLDRGALHNGGKYLNWSEAKRMGFRCVIINCIERHKYD